MSQPTFLLRDIWRRPYRIFLAATICAAFPEVRHVTYGQIGGMPIGHSTGTGRYDRSKIDITSPDVSSYVFRVARTSDGVKSVVRRLRVQEAEELEALDADINQLQMELATLRERRAVVLDLAFKRGNVVRLKEVEALLNQPNDQQRHAHPNQEE